MDPSKLSELLLLWMGVIGVLALARARWNVPGTGLTIAYLFNLSIIHWVGTAIYVLPAFQDHDPRMTVLGFDQSLYGVLAFAAGGLMVIPFLKYFALRGRLQPAAGLQSRLPRVYLACGVIFYLLSATFFGRLPTASAIIATGQQLVVVGLALCCWKAWREGSIRRLIGWLLVSLLLPFTTVITAGMLGYGAIAVLTILIFVASLFRAPVKVSLAGTLLVYLGLSAYVSYMRDRADIRAAVWGEQPVGERLDRVTKTVATFEWFDPADWEHLRRIDGRLNQNFLVGAAVYQLSQTHAYAGGDTLWDALLALIPRALWPDKNIQAGSGDLVSHYTGIDFAAGTSVGIGQVMEFYINFGTPGVVIGFLLMGVLVTALDWQAAERLARSDLQGFVLWFLPGIALLQVGGQLVELTASAAASLIVAVLVNRYLEKGMWRRLQPASGLQSRPALERLP